MSDNPSSIQVLFFSFAADRMNARELTVSIVPGTTTVQDLVEPWLTQLGAPLNAFMFSVNEEWAHPDTVLSTGDILAVIPPVAGG